MIQDMNYLSMLFINLLIVGAWHGTTFLLSVKLSNSYFQPDSALYRPWKWEKGGRWYRDVLHINEWKDRVPQFVGSGGFSKKHITDVSLDYLDNFISETCRAEWMHTWNLGSIFLTLIINQSVVGVTFTVLIFMGNAPFAMIQRYNRFRLEIVRKRLQRDASRAVAAV
ncbi:MULTISPECIES: glycosyl-4,4'-diaponeurosporenoate acyltransferase CrtO family protein [Caproicibacterium]|uniref:Glycosyl-4,4'-diaponeurosporenoate acyltransferase n=1 Tax=Caproicibacterium argilliputei TaxID=3030016 RepID=A0AA97DC35_9FIRM|nr:hypothetical protein [Caproicibacterium argilliputei]WOC32706.1 hypothetical protein PXC00_02195 [Caproicibacterium argilliputei]